MVSYEGYPINEDIQCVLRAHPVDFQFQPIFDRDGKVTAYEALMRPKGQNVLDYIRQAQEKGQLHALELVSFFGATAAFLKRNYKEKLCVNSFPSECFTHREAMNYSQCFPEIKDRLIIEVLEYTDVDLWKWEIKKAQASIFSGLDVSLDDFGTGSNDLSAVDFYCPNTVKLARPMISGIDTSPEKQRSILSYVERFHSREILALAEGVETRGEFDCLVSMGIDLFQGFYLGRPE